MEKILFAFFTLIHSGFIINSWTPNMSAEDPGDFKNQQFPAHWEWDFDDVPDDELAACCLWEYARESATITSSAADHWLKSRERRCRQGPQEDPQLVAAHERTARLFKEHLEISQFVFNDFWERFHKEGFDLDDAYFVIVNHVDPNALPWRVIVPEGRKLLMDRIGRSLVTLPIQQTRIDDLGELWRTNSEHLRQIRSNREKGWKDNAMCAGVMPSEPIELMEEDEETSCCTASAFTVDFSRFTDAEIMAGFSDWLKKHRPEHWSKPRRSFLFAADKGRKRLDLRVALERLGLMRILHEHSPSEMRTWLPEAWRKFGKKESDFRREIRAACSFFKGLFPFLPEGELPYSYERAGVINRRIDEEYEKFLKENGGRK